MGKPNIGDEVFVTFAEGDDGYMKGTLVAHNEDWTQVEIEVSTKTYKYHHLIPKVWLITTKEAIDNVEPAKV